MWQQDILGKDWVSLTQELAPIRGHQTVATLVSKPRWLSTSDGVPIAEVLVDLASESGVSLANADSGTPRPTTAILYIHGLNDYFFQTHVADHLAKHGLAFFALDLHGFGRSTRAEAARNDAFSLMEYGSDFAWATRLIKEVCGYENLVILAHSTGGLIASLWAHSMTGRATVNGLMLNSPWFDLNRGWFDRTVGTAFVDTVGEYVTDFVLENNESNYVRMLHKDIAGEWQFDLNLKREVNSPVRSGFFRAVREGQARLAQGLELDCAALVVTSDRTGRATDSLAVKRSSDVVLDVQHIVDRAPLLGADVEIVQIAGGVHDVALSSLGPRTQFLDTLTTWLRAHGFIRM